MGHGRNRGQSWEDAKTLLQLGEAIPFPAWACGDDGSFLWTNSLWQQYTGVSTLRMREEGWTDVLGQENLEIFLQLWESHRKFHEPFDHDCLIRGADGTFRINRISARRVVTTPHEPLWIGVCMDQQDERAHRDALRISEQRLHAAILDSRTTVFNQDPGLRYTWVCNPWPGFAEADLLGRTDYDIFDAHDAMLLTDIKASVIAKRVSESVVLPLRLGGHLYYYDAKFVPLIASDGGLVGITCVMTDVSDHKAGQLAVEASQERLHMILNASLDAIISIDANSRITLWAGSAEDIFGWTADEAIGKSMPELIMPEKFWAGHYAGVNRFHSTGSSKTLGQRIQAAGRRRNGHEFAIELRLALIPGENGTEFTAFIRDMSANQQVSAAA